MIQEDYVSVEIAKLLKEKGFNCDEISCIKVFKGHTYKIQDNVIYADEDVTIPTLQMAMKWLREIYKCCIVVYPEATDDDGSAGCLWGLEICFRLHHQYTSEKLYESYEEACEAAIKYCLENLI